MDSGRTLRRSAALIALVLSGVVAAFATMAPSPDEALPESVSVREPLDIHYDAAVLPSPQSYVQEERLQRGDTLARFLGRLGIEDAEIPPLVRLRVLRQLAPGSFADAEVDADGRLLSLRFLTPQDRLVEVTRDGDGFRASESPAKLEAQLAMRQGEIRSSLFAATDEAGVPDSIAMQLADIFAGEIDFQSGLRKGDRFMVVYQLYRLAGRPVRAGRVLAAEFDNRGKRVRAVYFAGADGKGGYYAPDGESLRKMFLRSPLKISRVTSVFGLRKDPYLHKWRRHTGVDYGAPIGTPVHATADGVVVFAGRKGGYGNAIVLQNRRPYSTLYGHLSRFARGLHRGTRVEQGDIIAYTGMTGWATGPHLHYEFRISGRPRNPLAIDLPAARPVPASDLPAFRRDAAPLVARLDLLATGTALAQAE